MLLLDTNAASELRRLPKQHATPFAAWFAAHSSVPMFLSVISLLEIDYGVRLKERHDRAQADILRDWMESRLLPAFVDRLLPVTGPIARRCAAIHVPDRRPPHDALIAATAAVHNLTLVTRNVRDFAPMGVPLLNPWEWGQ
jgi:predicted nucleic acid-binding protein